MSENILAFSEDIANAPPPPLLPVGPYPAEIIAASKRSGNKGEYAQIVFRINAENYPADFEDGDPDGIVLYYNFLKTEDNRTNRHRIRTFMEKIGGPMGHNIDLNALIGLTGTIEVGHRPADAFNDAPSVQIVRILAR